MIDNLREHLNLYEEMGFSVIPILPRDKRPAITAWMPYMTRRASEIEIVNWFSYEERNVGIVTGKVSDLAVLDFDDEDSYRLFQSNCGFESMTVKSGKGYHIYFKPDIHARTTTFILNGNLHHLKQEGGYVVAAPSVHSSGRIYTIINSSKLAYVHLGGIANVLTLIGAERVVGAVTERSPTWASDLCTSVQEGGRNQSAAQLTGLLIQKFSYDPGLIEGLMAAWNKMYCKPPLSDRELEGIVKGEYLRYGPNELRRS